MQRCAVCEKEILMPFTCKYCNLFYCEEHRLPEQHNCQELPNRQWKVYKETRETIIVEESIGYRFTHPECPKCKSKNFVMVSDGKLDTYECQDCDHSWKYPDENKEFLSSGKCHFERNPHYKKKGFLSKFRK